MRLRAGVTLLVGLGLAAGTLAPAAPAGLRAAAPAAATAPELQRVVSLGLLADGVTRSTHHVRTPKQKAKAKAKAKTAARAKAAAKAKAKAKARAKARAKVTVTLPRIVTPPRVVTPATPPAPVATSADFSLMRVGTEGKSARWNPCEPIGWRLNPRLAPATALADVTTALQRVTARTGISFVYEGATTDRPLTGAAHANSEDLLLGFGTPAEYPTQLAGNVVGRGGPLVKYSVNGAGVSGPYEIVGGEVLFSTAAQLPAGFGTSPTFGTLAMHEIGHAMGLDHAVSPREVMAPALSSASPTDYAAGDRAGLALVGAAGGCFARTLR